MEKIQEARESLEKYLKSSTIKNGYDAAAFRIQWLDAHPEFKDEDMFLDIEWQECYATPVCYDYCPSSTNYAKGFTVKILDQDYYTDMFEVYKRSEQLNKRWQERYAARVQPKALQ